jgi:hypothetical protein
MSLLKEMIFNVRRAVYTLASFLSSKNDKKQLPGFQKNAALEL